MSHDEPRVGIVGNEMAKLAQHIATHNDHGLAAEGIEERLQHSDHTHTGKSALTSKTVFAA